MLLELDKLNGVKPDKDLNTPLLLASWHIYERAAEVLVKMGEVSPDKLDKASQTTLCGAAWGGSEVAKTLLERDKVNRDKADYYYNSPLWYAAGDGYEAVRVVKQVLLL